MGRLGALAVALMAFFLAACGKDSGGSEDTPPEDINSVSTVVSSVSVLKLKDSISVTLGDRSELAGATAVLSIANDEDLSALADDQSSELDARYISNSFVTLSLTKAPTGPVAVAIKDASIIAQAASDEAPVIFAATVSESDTDWDAIIPLETDSSDETGNISATIPVYAFRSMEDGTYVAKLHLGFQHGDIVPAGAALKGIDSAKNLSPTYSTTADGLTLLCPLPSTGCTERSMFNTARYLSSYGIIKAHWGADFEAATPVDIFLPGGGAIDRGTTQAEYTQYYGKNCKLYKGKANTSCVNANSAGMFLVIKYGTYSIKVIHLSGINQALLNKDGTINSASATAGGTPVGKTGKTGAAETRGPHLHYELYARQISHKKTKAGTTTQLLAETRVDPFPHMVTSLEMAETTGNKVLKKDAAYSYTVQSFDAARVEVKSKVKNAQENNGGPPPPNALYDPTRKLCLATDKPTTLKFFPDPEGKTIFNGPLGTYCVRWGDQIWVKALDESAPATITVKFNTTAGIRLTSSALSNQSGQFVFSGNSTIWMGQTDDTGGSGCWNVECTVGRHSTFDLRLAYFEFDPSAASNNLRVVANLGHLSSVQGGLVAGLFTATNVTESGFDWQFDESTKNLDTDAWEVYSVKMHFGLDGQSSTQTHITGHITSIFPEEQCVPDERVAGKYNCKLVNVDINMPVSFDVLPKLPDRGGHDLVMSFAPGFPYCLKNNSNRYVPVGYDEMTLGDEGDCNFYRYSREDD